MAAGVQTPIGFFYSGAGGTSAAASITNAKLGQPILARFSCDATSLTWITGVTDSFSNTWVPLLRYNDSSFSGQSFQLWICVASNSAGSTTVTAAFDVSHSFRVASITALDGTAGRYPKRFDGSSVVTTALDVKAPSTYVESGDICCAGFVESGTSNTSPTADSPYTIRDSQNAAGLPSYVSDNIESTTGTRQAGFTFGTASQGFSDVITWDALAASAAATPDFDGADYDAADFDAGGGGGTTYTQTVSGGITPAGALVKQTNKILAGGITPSGAITRVVNKILAGAITPVGTLLKNTLKILSGNITPSGIVTAVRVIVFTVAGAITPAGTITKITNKILAGNLTPSGTINKLIAKIFGGLVQPSGDVTTTGGSSPPPTGPYRNKRRRKPYW